MKKLILLAVLSLSGCAVVDAYTMRHFDSTEYKLITEVRDVAEESTADCADFNKSRANAVVVYNQAHLYMLYETGLEDKDESADASRHLESIAQELKNRYNSTNRVSKTYCEIKFSSIATSAKLIQHVQGNRPR